MRLVILLLLTTATALNAQTLPPLRMGTQQVEIVYASAQEAANAKLSFASVYDNRDWAFSARWDDTQANSTNMHDHMVKYGLKGTFYLTQPDEKRKLGVEWAKALQAGGCSIGGHSVTHPNFATLKPAEIYWQVLANKIEWEDLLDTPLNSFAFAYGQFKSPDNPVILQASSEALQRAGYLHSVYSDFEKSNPYLGPGEISTGNQIVPGDKVVEAEAFQGNLDKIVTKWPEAYAKTSRCIFLGVHAWQAGEEWTKLDAVFEALAHKPNWWYCSQNEWAAYARQVVQSRLEATGEGATRRYVVTRPLAGEVGSAVPLTCVVSGATVQSVKVDGQTLAADKRGDLVVLNLPPTGALPLKIGHLDSPAEGVQGECADFPGLKLSLVPDPAAGKLTLACTAPAEAALTNVNVTFRLPLAYAPGVFTRDFAPLEAGKTQTVELALPAARPEPVWAEGQQYFVAQVDFTTPGGPGRVWVTRQMP